ncbi:MAG: TIGR03087 family PEP-CTERM/XrtA system glycosyltransferase [Methylohalobius sp.]|nr:TIGR03087 family PEP-CTERM/XrtA system glycosyltransferase [Methylohalobius sp.]
MANLLYLVHRIPYPPNKGDKIRSFHWLKHFSANHRVFLGAFVDCPEDWQYAKGLSQRTEEVCLRPFSVRSQVWRSIVGLLRGQPLTQACYADAQLTAWCRRLVEGGKIDLVFVFSSAMAQFVDPRWQLPKIIDFVDVDSDKWRQYAAKKPFFSRWIYRREGEKLLRYDRAVAQEFDLCLFVSPAEAELFKELAPEVAGRVDFVENGVDTAYFNPEHEFVSPYRPEEEALVFTGAMDYWANVDAVRWFADQVFPKVLQYRVEARFYIVGARPRPEVKALERREGIIVTGAVPDVRPYLAHARLAVAPLRIARGIQNKVLEALAMGKSVLATSMAMDGLEMPSGLDIQVADGVHEVADLVVQALREPSFLPRYSPRNREFIEMRYSWNRHLKRLDAILNAL